MFELGIVVYAVGIIGLAVFAMGSVNPRDNAKLAVVSLLINLAGGLFMVNNYPG